MRALYNLAARSTQKEFYSVAGGTHNDTFEVAGIDYYRKLRDFIRQHVEQASAAAAERDLAGGVEVAPAAVLGDGDGSGSGSLASVDEDGYLMVEQDTPSVALPTMTRTFQVR